MDTTGFYNANYVQGKLTGVEIDSFVKINEKINLLNQIIDSLDFLTYSEYEEIVSSIFRVIEGYELKAKQLVK